MKFEYRAGQGTLDVSCYAQAYADGTWGGRVGVTTHYANHSEDVIHELDEQDGSEQEAVARAVEWAQVRFR